MDLNIHIRLGHSDPLLGNFSALLHDAIERALQRATKLLRDAVEHNIRTPFGTRYHPAVAFGDLADSVRRAVYDQGDKQVGHVFLGGPAERYGLFVEVGTRPHWPPVSALIPWVQVKFGLKDLQQIRSAAWGVARSIATKGTRGHFMFQRALEKYEGDVLTIFQEEIARSLAKLN